jgi:hypothetical protein
MEHEIWADLAPTLHAMGTLDALSAPLFEGYCWYASLMIKANAHIDKGWWLGHGVR